MTPSTGVAKSEAMFSQWWFWVEFGDRAPELPRRESMAFPGIFCKLTLKFVNFSEFWTS